MATLSGTPACCWSASAPKTSYPVLNDSIHADVVVIGAGIVGLTAALRLYQSGRSVVVLEGRRVGGQVTGRSTAKITTQHALIYHHLLKTLGSAKAQAYADANRAGIKQIETWIDAYDIDCDLQTKSAYTYTCDPDQVDAIRKEAEAAHKVGIAAEVLKHAPTPFETEGALRFPDQAQFNPASYLVGLAAALQAQGGCIFEESRARIIDEGSRWRVASDDGTVHAEHIVVATNMTIKSPIGMSHRTQPRTHVAMAFRIEDENVIDGMFLGIDDPTHSFRTGRDLAGPLLIVLGPKFNTGQDGDVARRFRELEQWTRTNLPVGHAVWRWCNEDFDTADRVPYVGEPDPNGAPGFHIATGFNAWGISNGAAAGILISNRIANGSSSWSELYNPTRPYPEDFHQSGDTRSIVDSVEKIPPGEGGVITRDKEKIAVFRNEGGELQAFSASCTHKGCTLTWNNADRTWDCPCHGSIFDVDGRVIHGPARKALAAIEL